MPSQPTEKKKLSGFAFLEIGILEVLFVLIGILGLLGIFNYFNVLPVSTALPFLSFLPTRHVASTNKTVSNIQRQKLPPLDPKKIPIVDCPLEKNLCIGGIEIRQERGKISSFSALGYSNLPEKTDIKAVMDGNLKITENKDSTVFTITNASRNISAEYEIATDSISSSSTSAKVKRGDVMGSLNKPVNLKEFEKFEFIISVHTIDPLSYLRLKPASEGLLDITF